jgi:type VI protein secretion system component VasK
MRHHARPTGIIFVGLLGLMLSDRAGRPLNGVLVAVSLAVIALGIWRLQQAWRAARTTER